MRRLKLRKILVIVGSGTGGGLVWQGFSALNQGTSSLAAAIPLCFGVAIAAVMTLISFGKSGKSLKVN